MHTYPPLSKEEPDNHTQRRRHLSSYKDNLNNIRINLGRYKDNLNNMRISYLTLYTTPKPPPPTLLDGWKLFVADLSEL